MQTIIPVVVAIVLLLIALSFAKSHLFGQLAFLKHTGTPKAARWAVRSTWRGVAGLFRLLLRRRRPRIRRLSSRVPSGNVR